MIRHKRIYNIGISILTALFMVTSLNACTQKDEKKEVKIEKKEIKERFIVRGDLHVHSSYSHDSVVPAEQVVEESAKTGYDFIALTDHNTINHLKKDFSTKDCVVLPGYEFTLQTGHINLFGARKFDEKVSITTAKEITEFLNYFHNLGGIAQINHPNDPRFNAKFGYDVPADMIEVWNNAKFGEDDKKSVQDWHDLLCKGRKLVATAGTDEHKKHLDRSPFNCVFVDEKTADNIFDNIKKGHLYITGTKEGPDIQLTCGDAIMGDTVDFAADKSISLKIARIAPNSVIKVYSDKGIECEEKITDLQNSTFEKNLSMDGRIFYRVEVWTSSNSMIAISNPIFIRR